MARISTYNIDDTPTLNDKVIGTDVNDFNITKNYKISDMLSLAGPGILGLTSTRMYYGDANDLAVETTALTYIVGGEGTVAADTIKMSNATLNADVTHVNDANSLSLGADALPSTKTPTGSTAIGVRALQNADTIVGSVAVGTDAMQDITNGNYNVAVGAEALQSMDDGNNNVAVGYRAHNGALTGERNAVVGAEAMRDSLGNTDNVAVGYRAAYQLGSSAIHNVAIGCATMQGALLGQFNVAVGSFALFQQTGGDFNVAVGNAAWNNLLAGNNNTAIGKGAGAEYDGGGFVTGISNTTCLGHNARPVIYGGGGFADDQVVLGNSNVQRIFAAVTNITALSDARDKANIQDLPLGLNFLMDVQPRMWDWNTRDGSRQGRSDAGFVAQELDAALAKHNGDSYVPNLVTRGEHMWGVASGELIPILVNAIKELKAEIDLLKNG